MEKTIKTIVILATSLALYSCGGGSDITTNNTDSGSLKIKRASTSTELETYLKSSLIHNYATQVNTTFYELASTDSTTTSASEESTSAFSTTNTQETSVDEADRLKTDGEYLYTSSINRPEITIFQADDNATKVSNTTLNTLNQATLSGLYLRSSAKQLVALSDDGTHSFPMWDMWFGPHYWYNRKTELFALDINDPSAPEQQVKITLDGQLISSRRIGSTVYLATRHTPSIDGLINYPTTNEELSGNLSLIDNASLDDMLPSYQLNDGSKINLFTADECFISDYAQSKSEQSSVISLIAIDLDESSLSPRGQCFVGDAETVYASTEALYLATTRYTYSDLNGVASYSNQVSTEIHKFSLDGETPEYSGSGSVPGHLGWQQDLKAFRMSEYNDILRVITYTGNHADSNSSPAHLYTLEENTATGTLDILGSLPNDDRPELLGKVGEQIYATRFIGERAYLVTFRMTDPLYIVDLSDPADPFIASELEINGYSDYLHPVGDNFLLGIGKDAVPSTDFGDGRGAWYQGVKLSLIDIYDASAPFEKEQIILGKRGSETAVLQTHHALTALLKGDSLEVALPISIHETSYDSHSYTHPSNFYGWTKDELYRLSINTTTGEIAVLPSIDSGRVPETDDHYYSWEWPYDRSAIINEKTYYLRGDEVLVR